MTLETHAQKLVAGLVRVAVMAPADPVPANRAIADPAPTGTAGDDHGMPPAQRQVLLALSRRDREFRLSDLTADLGSTLPATLALVSPLIARDLVEMRPAPPHAARDMRVAATERGLALTPAPADWAEPLRSDLQELDNRTQHRLLRLVTTRITGLQQEGRVPASKMCLSCRFFEGYRHAGAQAPHHCWFVDAPLGYHELRLHCPDHIVANAPPRT